MAGFLTGIAGLTCLVIWMFARTYGVLVVFAIVQGIFWGASGTVTTDIIGLTDLGSALSVLWLSLIVPCTFSEPIGVWLLDYSQRHLQRTGGDAFLISIGFSGATFIAGASA